MNKKWFWMRPLDKKWFWMLDKRDKLTDFSN